MYKFKNILFLFLLICTIFSSSPSAFAANYKNFLENQEHTRIQELNKTETDNFLYPYKYNKKSFDWGGWVNYTFFDFQDEDNNNQTDDILNNIHYFDMRLWFKNITERGNIFYLRTKSTYSNFDWDPTLNYDETDETELKIDMAYFQLAEYKNNYIRLGRQYFHIGRGITFSGIKDGLLFNGLYENWNLQIFGAHSLPHENNSDTSVPGWNDKEKRIFYGAQAKWTSDNGNEIYAYYVSQDDNSPESPDDPLQDYNYNSSYIGLGIEGSFNRKSQYYAEIIHETGDSYANGQSDSIYEKIDAWAGLIGTKYYFDSKTKPVLSLEWAFGSGDGDSGSVTNTINGNLAGTSDHNFRYFGSYDGGDALSPRLSNISILRTGMIFKPFINNTNLKNLSFGAYYSLYKKMKQSGAISDQELVSTNNEDIGNGLDLILKWNIYSDLSLHLTWSKFTPGDAYLNPNNSSETLLYTSLIYNF